MYGSKARLCVYLSCVYKGEFFFQNRLLVAADRGVYVRMLVECLKKRAEVVR